MNETMIGSNAVSMDGKLEEITVLEDGGSHTYRFSPGLDVQEGDMFQIRDGFLEVVRVVQRAKLEEVEDDSTN